jgi:trimethyllysine dioxygenase
MIESIKILPNSLRVRFKNRYEENYPNIWLRDHTKDEKNWDKRSHQRKTFTASLDLNIQIKEAKIKDQGKCLDILWADMDKTVQYSYEYLFKNTLINKSKDNNLHFWNKNEIKDDIYLNYQNLLKEDGFKIFLKKLYSLGFCVITNCETKLETVGIIANKIGYVRQSIFGGLWEFESNEDMADSAYTQEELRPHTDSTYSNDAPGLQLLLCCDYKANGGESIMVDGYNIAETMKNNNKDLFDILSKIDVPGKYVGDGVILEAKRPVFRLDNKELVQVSFNNYDRTEFRIEEKATKKFYEAIKKFDELANSDKFQWRHVLKPGELLIFNNWRILHGRGSFKGKRKMAGCYVNMEDFRSACKIHGVN